MAVLRELEQGESVQVLDRPAPTTPNPRAVRPFPIRASRSRGFTFATHPLPAEGPGDKVKRLLDIVLGSAALAVLSPIMLAAAIAIKLDSPGPVLIGQERASKDLERFKMLKFRSMVHNAHEMLADLEAFNEATPPLFKMRKDPRLTRVGRHLRRLSIDELPQLINVVRGDMSLVGPRPPLVTEVDFDYRRQATRLRRRPGMTGLWQVSGRSDLPYEDMIALDLRYVREWSVLLDLEILLKTPAVVLSGRGAR